jgi:hypothetical protein
MTLSALVAVLALTAPTPPPQDAARPPLLASLADVAFMAGHWVGGDPGDLSEEVWSAPEGDSMMGMWRFVKKGATRIYEMLTLTSEEGKVVLRIRHFDPKLVAREEKERAVELLLVVKGPEYNVKGIVRLTYTRPADDTLESVLEKEGSQMEFRFKRR